MFLNLLFYRFAKVDLAQMQSAQHVAQGETQMPDSFAGPPQESMAF